MTTNLSQRTYRIHLHYRVPRGTQLPVSANGIVRKWASLPGVLSVTDSTCFYRGHKFDMLRGPIVVEFASPAYMRQALARRH